GLISKRTGASPIVPTIVAAIPTPRSGFDVPVRSRSQAVGNAAVDIVGPPAAPEIAASVAVAPTDGLGGNPRLKGAAREARVRRAGAGEGRANRGRGGRGRGPGRRRLSSAETENDRSPLA